MTVEIVFALVTAALLAGVVFAAAWVLALALGLSGPAEKGVVAGARCSEPWPGCGVWYGCCSGSTGGAERAADHGPSSCGRHPSGVGAGP